MQTRVLSWRRAATVLGGKGPCPYAVRPGTTVLVETADCYGCHPSAASLCVGGPNPVTGPIAVRGLRPGDTLAVDILSVTPVGAGFVGPAHQRQNVPCANASGVLRYCPGFRVPLRPNIGTIGVAPVGSGVPTTHAGDHGGNLDCSILGPGTTVCFAVAVPGASLGAGDVHAAMGDGEVSGQGIETAAEVLLRPRRVPGLGLQTPYGVRGDIFFVIAAGTSLERAADRAQAQIVTWLTNNTRLGPETARRFLGVATDLRVGSRVGPTPTVWLQMPLNTLPRKLQTAIHHALALNRP